MNDTLAIRPQTYSLAPRSFDECVRFAELVAKSDLATKDYRGKPGNVMIAVQMGVELGLSKLVITGEVPPQFQRTKTETDCALLRDFLKEGNELEFARLEQSTHLRFR